LRRSAKSLSGTKVLVSEAGTAKQMFQKQQSSSPTPINDQPDFPRRFARRAAIINGLLAFLGVSIASYVYFSFPIPDTIDYHSLDKFGQPISAESATSYLFSFPVLQVAAFLVPLLSARRGVHPSASEQERADETVARIRAVFPWIRPAEPSTELYQIVFIGLVIIEVLILALTIYRSVLAAMGGT
jgi:hypothetical protein